MSLCRTCLIAIILVSFVLGLAPISCRQPAPPPAPPPPSPAAGNVTVELVASNLTFNLATITVPAGAAVTLVLKNNDSGIPHNFAVYQNLPAAQTTPIFVGYTITGPATARYHFIAPATAGDYFFECDVHPQQMNGKFIVTVS